MSRAERLCSEFDGWGIEALVVTSPSNIRYLTGFTGSNGTVVVSDDGATLLTDSRYVDRAADEIAEAGTSVEIVQAPGTARAELLSVLENARRVGFESEHVSWATAVSLIEDLGETRTVSTTGLVEQQREIKEPGEVELMREAARIADTALASLLEDFGPGLTERQIARRLDDLVLDGGADAGAFETIVASGVNAARPHHQASARPLAAGDLVIIDFGAEYRGYRSDMTRSFVLGKPSPRQQEMLDGVREAQQVGVDVVGPGVAASAVDDACRTHLVTVGLAEWFTHGTGHGVGLDIHEAPSVSAKGTATLAPGHVITVEPGVYIPDFGGVRWEDTVVVTNSGAEPLTRSAKQPVVL